MAYVPLALSDSLPGSIQYVIREVVEKPLQDVHWMLATHVGISTADGPARQLGLPITLVLLTTVAGVSKVLLNTTNSGDGKRFRECLIKYFPWCSARPHGASREDAAHILYKYYRNPLVHALGFNKRTGPRYAMRKPFPGTDDHETRIEELEHTTEEQFEGCFLHVTEKDVVLDLHDFYWGVRKLVEAWSRDHDQVSYADARLTRRADKGDR